MSKVVVDSSAYFAFVNRNDTHHAEAVAIFDRLRHDPSAELYTTEFVVAETHALIVNKLKRHDIGVRFLQEMVTLDASGASASGHIVAVTKPMVRAASQLVEQRPDVLFSLTDAVSFVVMQQKHIPHAFSFDEDFAKYGVLVLHA